MPIVPPALDDRTYDDLLADLLARIPSHTPEWTHVRSGDPGRTLLELFAWLGDTLLYRVNLIPEKQRLAFLRLLGLEPRPALAATGMVTLAFDQEDATVPALVAAGTEIAGPARFETRKLSWVFPLVAQPYIKRKLDEKELEAFGDVLDGLPAVYGLAQERPVYYATTPIFNGGAARPDGLDLADETVDLSIWIALFAARKENMDAARASLEPTSDGVHRRVSIGVAPKLALADPLDVLGAATRSAMNVRVPVVWEVCPKRPDDPMIALDPEDGSDGLTRDGIVELVLPGENSIGAPSNDVAEALHAGVGNRPPRIDDPELAERLVTWLRMRLVAPPGQPAPRAPLSWLGFGAVAIDQRRTVFLRQIGESTGLADQVFALHATSVEPATLVIQVAEEGHDYQDWQRVPDLALAGRDENAYSLRAEEGSIGFGDGVRGRIPPEGARIRIARMRAGGGERGNLQPGSLKEARVDNKKLKVQQGLPTRGGQDAETLAEAEKRIPAILRHRDRAVTEEDFRALAAVATGVRVARVEVLPRFSPKRRQSGVPGVVTVMALPDKVGVLPPAPRADRVFLERVFAYLDPRRPLATELSVIGCAYVPLAVSVAVVLREGFERDEVLAAVRLALRQYLWPLAPGGPLRAGWPLGATVRARELEVVVARVEGIEEVTTPNLFVKQSTGRWERIVPLHECDPTELGLARWELPELLDVVVVEGEDSPEAIDAGDGGDGDGGPAVPIPVVPEVC
jgi:hypothetical protein